MENISHTSQNEVIKIDTSCLQEVKIDHDMESEFKYWNIHFLSIAFILCFVYGIQVYYGLPDEAGIDMANFTYKFSNYREGGNSFGIFTGMFLHGSLGHLISNLIFLYPLTLITASILRNHIFVVTILITGIVSGQASYALNNIPSLGSSGWIFGIFGFLVPYYIYNKKSLSTNVQDIPWVFLCMAVYIVWQGMLDPHIDNIAHIVGFISGIVFGFIYFHYYYIKSEK